MTTSDRRLRRWPFAALAWLLVAGLVPAPAAAQVFLPDDPVAVDPDRADVPKPARRSLSDYYDYVENAAGPGRSGRATNINTLGEVPRSSWYAGSRHYPDRLSLDALRRGALRGDGPAPGPWTVVGGKSEDTSPGLTIVDGAGDRYLLKFDGRTLDRDAPHTLELSTGAEAVATRLVYALGYHVPENYLVRFDRARLVPGEDATYETPTGDEKPLTGAALDALLTKAARYDDGAFRALASLSLPGAPLGPFQYHGTRPDDGNDLFPHELRRELRGFRVAAAWINHDDARSAHSLDMYVTETGAGGVERKYVKHYLIDFGTTFGGGPLGPKAPWVGYEHIVEPGTVLLSALTLGFAGRPWTAAAVPDLPAVGHFDAEAFAPRRWKQQYHNPAFANMDADDAFWMARQVAHFTDDELRALVATGRYSDPRVTDYLARTLAARRDKIARAYLGHGGGFDRFAIAEEAPSGEAVPSGEAALTFADLVAAFAARSGPPLGAPRYTVRWFGFDNATGRRTEPLAATTLAAARAPVPDAPEGARFLVAALARTDAAAEAAARVVDAPVGPTEVYLRRLEDGCGWQVVGVRRHHDALRAALRDAAPVWTVVPARWRRAATPASDPAPAASLDDG